MIEAYREDAVGLLADRPEQPRKSPQPGISHAAKIHPNCLRQKRTVSGVLTEGIIHRMGGLGEPARASFRDEDVVLEPDAELAVDADHRLI